MNVEHINAFIQGAQTITTSVCGETPTIGAKTVKAPPYQSGAAAVSSQLGGDVAGSVIYSLDLPSACAIASRMIGMPVTALDAISSSALEELSNMVSSNAATLFGKQGLKVSVSAPTFHTNASQSDFPFITATSKILSIPLVFKDGSVFALDIPMS